MNFEFAHALWLMMREEEARWEKEIAFRTLTKYQSSLEKRANEKLHDALMPSLIQ
jgi:hypothetical protein